MKMNKPTGLPKIISIVSIFLGAIDLARGVMHTMLLDFAAANIAGLDLLTIQASDLRQLMGSFGISNFITGITLILLGWKARELAWVMLGVIPGAYLIGGTAIKLYNAGSAESGAAWGGAPMMAAYLAISTATFIYGLWKRLS